MPKVTICLPTFNGGQFLEKGVLSILSQSYKEYELLICDDASIDDSLQVVGCFTDPRISVISNPTRLGLVGNWNRCLDLARGEYIYIFHQDDVMLPDDLEKKVTALDSCPQAGMVFSDIHVINEQDQIIGGHWNPVLPNVSTLFPGQEFFRLLLLNGNLVPCQTVLARKSLYQKVGAFNPRLGYTPDFEMWLRMALYSDILFLADPTVQLRRHPGQESRNYLGKPAEVCEVLRAFQIVFTQYRDLIMEAETSYRLGINHVRTWSWSLAKQAVHGGDLVASLNYLKLTLQAAIIQNQVGRYNG